MENSSIVKNEIMKFVCKWMEVEKIILNKVTQIRDINRVYIYLCVDIIL